MRERNRKANTPVRQVMMIEQAKIPGGKGGINRLSAGVGMGAGRAFQDVIVCVVSLPPPPTPPLVSVPTFYEHHSDFVFSSSHRKRNRRTKHLSNVWPACRATNSSTTSSAHSETNLAGPLKSSERRRNSPRPTSRKCFRRLRFCIGAESIMGIGSSRRITRMIRYVDLRFHESLEG